MKQRSNLSFEEMIYMVYLFNNNVVEMIESVFFGTVHEILRLGATADEGIMISFAK